jgi:transposase InsO family protein
LVKVAPVLDRYGDFAAFLAQEDVTEAFKRLRQSLRCDNGPEYISGALQCWAEAHGIDVHFIQPGKPQQNAYVERYNRTVRHEWLEMNAFDTIEQA